jgi:hypothetical protein
VGWWFDFIAGWTAGTCGTIVGYPLDFTKVRIQTGHYKNIVDVITKTYTAEGLSGFFKGITAPLITDGFVDFLTFGVFGVCKRLLQKDSKPLTNYEIAMAGAATGAFVSVLVTPSEMAKIRLQIQVQSKEKSLYRGTFHCLSHVYRHQGIKEIYRGLPITFCREVPGYSIYFTSYEYLRGIFGKNGSITFLGQLMAGGLAGSALWFCVYPIDVIKTRIQMAPSNLSLLSMASEMYRRDGFFSFYKGITPTLVRAIPVNAVIFLVYEKMIELSHYL